MPDLLCTYEMLCLTGAGGMAGPLIIGASQPVMSLPDLIKRSRHTACIIDKTFEMYASEPYISIRAYSM